MEQIGDGKMGTVGLTGTGMDPFGVCPDPRFIYFSEKLRRDYEALLPVLRRGHALVVVLGARGKSAKRCYFGLSLANWNTKTTA